MRNTLNSTFCLPEEEHLKVEPVVDSEQKVKIDAIKYHFQKIMEVLELDMQDDSLKETPGRVAEMYVNEIFEGLNPNSFPQISLFENTYQYKEMLIERNGRHRRMVIVSAIENKLLWSCCYPG